MNLCSQDSAGGRLAANLADLEFPVCRTGRLPKTPSDPVSPQWGNNTVGGKPRLERLGTLSVAFGRAALSLSRRRETKHRRPGRWRMDLDVWRT